MSIRANDWVWHTPSAWDGVRPDPGDWSARRRRRAGRDPFAMVQIDGGAARSAAVADLNNDGLLDIVSAES